MKARITVVGSLNMDLALVMDRIPKVGETIKGKYIRYLPGGKGANQAVGCARLGAEVCMIGAIGNDSFGETILRSLAADNVNTDCLNVVLGETTGMAAILQTESNNSIVIIPGANDHCKEHLVFKNKNRITNSDVLLTQLEIPIDAVECALRLARAGGVKTVLNPAPARALTKELLQHVDYLTPNETEFEILTGCTLHSEAELTSLLMEWEKEYRHKIVLTRGEKGCSYLGSDGQLQTVAPAKVKVVDTTGAGDSFNAALSVAISRGLTLEEAVHYAVVASSLSVTKFGAQAGMPTNEALHRMRQ